MKTLLAVAALLTLAACSVQSTAPHRLRADSASHRNLQPGDPCTTSDGRSGYLVTAGNKLVCQAS